MSAAQGKRKRKYLGQPPATDGAVRQQLGGTRGRADGGLPRAEAKMRGSAVHAASQVGEFFLERIFFFL